MRLGLISDIHSNLVALEAVLAELDGIDRLLCLGDVVDLGPQPAETVARLQHVGAEMIRGNHDPLNAGDQVPFLQDIESWTREQLSPEQHALLRSTPRSIEIDEGGWTLLCTHGSPRSFHDGVTAELAVDELERMVGGARFDVLATGHTHVQMSRRVAARTYVNIGSVGMPFELPFNGTAPRILPWAEYAVITMNRRSVNIDLRRTRYDLKAFARTVHGSGMPHVGNYLGQWAHGWSHRL